MLNFWDFIQVFCIYHKSPPYLNQAFVLKQEKVSIKWFVFALLHTCESCEIRMPTLCVPSIHYRLRDKLKRINIHTDGL